MGIGSGKISHFLLEVTDSRKETLCILGKIERMKINSCLGIADGTVFNEQFHREIRMKEGCNGGFLSLNFRDSLEEQLIKTNQTNILIRSLMLKNKSASSIKDGKGTAAGQSSKKRSADRALDCKAAGKRAMSSTQLSSLQEGSSQVVDKNLQNKTVERLRALLKEKGLSPKGKKDELIARLRA